MVVLKKITASTQQDTGPLKLNGVKGRISKVHAGGKAKLADHSSTDTVNAVSHTGSEWRDNLVERGKDLLSKEAGGVATAAAIVVGAALIEIELIPGLIIGAGAILLGKMFPDAASYVRPAIKGAVRAGFSATHKVREILAEANEQVNDLVAEVKNEQKQPLKQEHSSTKSEAAIHDLSTH